MAKLFEYANIYTFGCERSSAGYLYTYINIDVKKDTELYEKSMQK